MEISLISLEQALNQYTNKTEGLVLERFAQLDARLRALEHAVPDATILHKDVLVLQARIRVRADVETEKYKLTRKGMTQLRVAIKRAVLTRYGLDDLHDLPQSRLAECQTYIDQWPAYRAVMAIRERTGTK